MPRALLLVMDSLGIGGAADADRYFNGVTPDSGANTLGHIAEACADGHCDARGTNSGALALPNLVSLGLGQVAALATGRLPPGMEGSVHRGQYASAAEISRGKDTPSGHYEIVGLPVQFDWGYFPPGPPSFSPDLVAELLHRADLPGILGNRHASGTEIIAELGELHQKTGKPICYSSADSVFQIAAHEESFGLERLYQLCEIVRELVNPLRIGRVIARPFVGSSAAQFKRTGNRRDYATPPPGPTLLNAVEAAGGRVWAVGKISDIFAGVGITTSTRASGLDAIMQKTLEAWDKAQSGDLLFTNFVDFDAVYGHRRDIAGYAAELERFDAALPPLLAQMTEGDLLIITADHGNDPSWVGSDHTREQVPLLLYEVGRAPGISHGQRSSFADIGQTIAEHLGLLPLAFGEALAL